MRNDKVALKTLAIKARVANHLRKTLYKQKIENISNEQKVQYFDEWFKINHEMHWELNAYKDKRKAKRKVEEERKKRKMQEMLPV